MVVFIFLFSFGSAFASTAPSPDHPTELFFPVDKNNIQILPQRFEYQLINKDQIQIGNILIDANEIDFNIVPTGPKSDRLKLQFRWPAGLLDRGEIAIKDNSGKGVWFQSFQKNQIKVSQDTNLAVYETETDVQSLLRVIRMHPFFKFCVHREEPLTKIYLCSKDLYLRKAKKGRIEIDARDSFRPQSFVEINGQSVGNQGMIFLNSPQEFISMRALLLSGATLELDTRMKKINFKDVSLSADGKQIIVKAKGTEPVDPLTVEHKPGDPQDEWQTRLEVERPYTFLKGEGDLPLRQEFLIQGSVRTEDVKVHILSEAQLVTFKDEYDLKIKPAEGMTLSLADRRSKLDKREGNEYDWTLTDLRKDEVNRRFVRVHSGSNSSVAAYDIERRGSFDASLRLLYPLWGQVNLLYTPSLNWGITAQYDQNLMKSENETDVKIAGLAAQYRFPSGVHLRDQTYWFDFSVQSLQATSQSVNLLGVGIGAEWKSPSLWSKNFPWVITKLRLPLASTDADLKLKTGSFEGEFVFRHMRSSNYYWDIGVRSYSFVLESSLTEVKSSKSFALFGVGWIF